MGPSFLILLTLQDAFGPLPYLAIPHSCGQFSSVGIGSQNDSLHLLSGETLSETNKHSLHRIRDNIVGFDDAASDVFVIVLIKIGYAMLLQKDREKERYRSLLIHWQCYVCS